VSTSLNPSASAVAQQSTTPVQHGAPSLRSAAHRAVKQINNQLRPEWLRVPEAVRVFGLCRSAIYILIAEGAIRSTALRKRGAIRGIRLISYDSLADYVERAANEGGIAK